MRSMTGYGYGELQNERFSITVEIRSYNNRYLDLVLNLPPSIASLEERVRDFARERCSRGRVEFFIRFRDNSEALNISLDESSVKAYTQVLERLRQLSSVQEPVGLSHLLSVEGLVRIERQRDPDESWKALEGVVAQAMKGLEISRDREGESIHRDLVSQLQRIIASLAIVEGFAPKIEEHIRSGLKQRFAEVLGNAVEEQRMLAEVAVQLNRLTINEELVRLNSHMTLAHELVNGNEAAGKKLDFLCQEINREINTIGSKNIFVEVANAVIDVKDALENIREQIRNVE